jgi:hypothetical protein
VLGNRLEAGALEVELRCSTEDRALKRSGYCWRPKSA